MAIQRTAKGTATDKTGSLIFTISDVQIARRLLVVGIAYNMGEGAPTIRWGQQLMRPIQTVSGNGVVTRIVAYKRHRQARTNDIVATWTGTAPQAKAMFASTYSEVGTFDIETALAQASTNAPNAGAVQSSAFGIEAFIGAMGSEGPVNDSAGTPSGGYTAGQRAGTNGPPPASNITIQEIFKLPTVVESTQAELTGVTSRDWASVLASFSGVTDVVEDLILFADENYPHTVDEVIARIADLNYGDISGDAVDQIIARLDAELGISSITKEAIRQAIPSTAP